MKSEAVFSECGKYRYLLTRKWGYGRPCGFVMLNPSTADALHDDPTIRRCVGFAKAWGCAELTVVNLFAVRATSPRDMMRADDPVGPENKEHVQRAATYVAGGGGDYSKPRAGPFVCAWGAHGSFWGQDETVLGWLEELLVPPLALRLTKHGHPAHPLYLPAGLVPRALDSLDRRAWDQYPETVHGQT